MPIQSQLKSLTETLIPRLRKKPDDVIVLRHLHSTLSTNMSDLEEPREFLIALLYKNLIEDVLSNCLEDDYVELEPLREVLNLLVSSWDSALNADTLKAQGKWLTDLNSFAKHYRYLPWFRRTGEYVTIDAIKFFIADQGDPLMGLPPAKETGSKPDGVSRAFPNLDASLTDPKTSWQIRSWYVQQLMALRQRLNRQGRDLDGLCFIEKPYATIGAIGLIAHLVEQLSLPAGIYRSGYWDEDARVSGTWPKPGTTIALIYDVAIHGSVLLEAAEQLQRTFDVRVVAAVVIYDFEQGANHALMKHGIELLPYRRSRDVEHRLNKALAFLSPLGIGEAKITERARESGEELGIDEMNERAANEISEALDAYRLAV